LGHEAERIRGSGAKYLVSNLGEFDFLNGHMRLISIHPNVSLETVRKKTGFGIEIKEGLVDTSIPTEEELHLLRNVIDPFGIRKLEFLSGPQRNAAIRSILERERQH
jgi:hypothetical protein